LEEEVARLKAEQQKTNAKLAAGTSHLTFLDELKVRLTGYSDIGLFKATGDGVAYVRDFGGQMFPGEAAPWVFWGDPWSNMINSQGDSADLGLDRTVIPRFDPIQSHGHLSFIINTVDIGFVATLGSK